MRATCLALARGLVRAKIANSRTLLRRNWPSEASTDELVTPLTRDAESDQGHVAGRYPAV